MGFNRIEAKFRAKVSIRQGQPGVMRVTLVFLLLTSLLSTVVEYLTFDPSVLLWDLVDFGYEADEVLPYIWSHYSHQIWLYLAVIGVLGIYTTIMDFGYISYSLRLSRNEDPELSHIFDGFLKLLRVLWMNLLRYLFVTLWTLLGMVPAMILLSVGLLIEMDLYSLLGSYFFMVLLGALVGVVASYRYCLAEYFLLDDPSRKALTCIRLSKGSMKGWKMERFTLDMSFLGWVLCGALIADGLSGIWYPAGLFGMLAFNAWYLPYRCVTEANFYNSVSRRPDPFRWNADGEGQVKELDDASDQPGF